MLPQENFIVSRSILRMYMTVHQRINQIMAKCRGAEAPLCFELGGRGQMPPPPAPLVLMPVKKLPKQRNSPRMSCIASHYDYIIHNWQSCMCMCSSLNL